MGAVPSIRRLPGRRLKVAGNAVGRHAVQDRAMKEERAAPSSLGISRNFSVVNRKIADAPEYWETPAFLKIKEKRSKLKQKLK